MDVQNLGHLVQGQTGSPGFRCPLGSKQTPDQRHFKVLENQFFNYVKTYWIFPEASQKSDKFWFYSSKASLML